MSLASLKQKALQDEMVRTEYEKLADEFDLVNQLITIRTSAGLTQEVLARRIGTAKGNISRLERGKGNPSWATLKKYANACGYQVKLQTVSSSMNSPSTVNE
ncbi:helix-turn-helix domain-containing protein [Marinobacter sp. DY40_1A1]|uniref:helix-turn-helix domain-containing protein n=1 Tax=Marinobacter sp. DY40_1A1 TaxID=2583229 RepID=UPI001904BCB5|nr:helix-turn-helix transcriptional regulator [Marinobacter sp. DY40_1A1]MBK1885460.1 helix-turn-helix transcriptional regulator [Marinobacter sp. DY40_1A1]